jgi:hypothetical protein
LQDSAELSDVNASAKLSENNAYDPENGYEIEIAIWKCCSYCSETREVAGIQRIPILLRSDSDLYKRSFGRTG